MVTQYAPGSTGAVICGVAPGVVMMAVLSAHLATPVVGTPRPRPIRVKGPPALVSNTVTVPTCVAVKVRDTALLTVSLLANVLVVGDVGAGVGVVVVAASLPQVIVSDAAPRAATTATTSAEALMSSQG